MRTKDGYTPTETACSLTMGWIRAMVANRTADIEDLEMTPSLEAAVRKQLAKIHNRLLDKSKLDGQYLDTE
jgi:hypothetical protein